MGINDLLVQIRSPVSLMNSANEILDWGLTPTYKNFITREYTGSFLKADFHGYLEATERIIVPIPAAKETFDLIYSARKCLVSKLKAYQPKPEDLKCSAVDLPPVIYL